MPTLHLGVVEIPYQHEPTGKPQVSKKGKVSVSVETTGQVAEILEGKYHVFEHFFQAHGQQIADAMAESLAGALENLAMGAPVSGNPFGSAESKLDTMFRTFISKGEMDTLGYPGIPTAAALKGVDHRLKHPYAKGNPRRPSFRDTGLYERSFKTWVD